MHIGPYRVLRVLARGGMGEVCLATLERAGGFRKQVALKRALPEFAADPDFVAMFQREARVAAALNHRNIVQVFDFDHHADQAWIAMEYVRGVDLKAALDAERLPLGLAIDIGLACARGLDYVHRATDASGQPLNLVHQDVSPANVLLSYEGDVKLSDFGVAWQRHTAQRGLQGKLGYMSPEAVRGARLDARSDQFALGVVLYEMLAGRRAFWAEDGAEAILERIRRATPLTPLADVAPDVPAAVRAVVERALAVDPAARFADVAALSDALVAAADGVDRSLALGAWLSARFPAIEALPSEPPVEVTAAAVAPIIGAGGTAPPAAPITPPGETAPPIAAVPADLTGPSIAPIREPSKRPAEAPPDEPPSSRMGLIAWVILLIGGGAAAALFWPDAQIEPPADAAPEDAQVIDAAPKDAQVVDAAPEDARVIDAAPSKDAAVVTAPSSAPRTRRPRAPSTRAPRTRPPKAPSTRAPRTVASVAAAPPTVAPVSQAAPSTRPAPPPGPRLRVLSRGARLSGGRSSASGWYSVKAGGALVRVPGQPALTVRLKPQAGRFVATVASRPFAALTVDGRPFGSTPAAQVPLSAGRHAIDAGGTRLVVELGF